MQADSSNQEWEQNTAGDPGLNDGTRGVLEYPAWNDGTEINSDINTGRETAEMSGTKGDSIPHLTTASLAVAGYPEADDASNIGSEWDQDDDIELAGASADNIDDTTAPLVYAANFDVDRFWTA